MWRETFCDKKSNRSVPSQAVTPNILHSLKRVQARQTCLALSWIQASAPHYHVSTSSLTKTYEMTSFIGEETAKDATSFPFHLVNKYSSKRCSTALRAKNKAAYNLFCPATKQIWCGGTMPRHNILIAVPANGTSFTQLGEWCIVYRQVSCFCLSLPARSGTCATSSLVTYTFWQDAVYTLGAELSIVFQDFLAFFFFWEKIHPTFASGLSHPDVIGYKQFTMAVHTHVVGLED